jgi:2-polyprenyl-6-methoxyphenol hydroxylase-like FAD-dependent oxidoreductase
MPSPKRGDGEVNGNARVIGGGIGGIATAVALRRAGWEIAVFERAPDLGEVGAGISLWRMCARQSL